MRRSRKHKRLPPIRMGAVLLLWRTEVSEDVSYFLFTFGHLFVVKFVHCIHSFSARRIIVVLDGVLIG